MRAGARFCSSNCRLKAHRRAKSAGDLPAEMKTRARFVRFTSTKRPITATGRSASSTNADTWSTHAAAAASTEGEGVGFVLGDGIGCIDLDHCIQDGTTADWAQQVIDANPGTYIEVSRSGEGIHIFGRLDEGPGRNFRDGERAIEVYSVGRYIALTGNRYGAAPLRLAALRVPTL
jgi:primase-polymerase (primpol)-like protein